MDHMGDEGRPGSGIDPILAEAIIQEAVARIGLGGGGRTVLAKMARAHGEDRAAKRKVMGRPRSKFSGPQVEKCLRLISEGHGRVRTCALVGVSYRTFLRKLREDAEFAFRLRTAETERIEDCEAALIKVATGTDMSSVRVRAAIAYLGRRDKLAAAARARKEKAREAGKTPAAKRGTGSSDDPL
jgi:hypothetical protein